MRNFNDINNISNLSELEDYKKDFMAMCESRKIEIILKENGDKLVSKSFGYIKENFEALSTSLFKTKEGRNIIKKYITCIKEDKNLSKLHSLYESIRRADSDVDSKVYINEALSLTGVLNEKDCNTATLKLGNILKEAYILLKNTDMPSEENEQLNESINYVATHNKTLKNLVSYSKSLNVIQESIDAKKSEDTIKKDKMDIEEAINNFNEKYTSDLDSCAQDIVKEVASAKNKEDVFNKYKNECVQKISEKKSLLETSGDNESVERLTIIQEKVENKTYNKTSASNDIISLIEITKSLD